MSKNSSGDQDPRCICGTEKELEMIKWIRTVGNLGRAIRNVHDFAVHFSEIQIEGEIKGDLYLTAQIAESIEEIEKTNQS
jgi:hypothetical protein